MATKPKPKPEPAADSSGISVPELAVHLLSHSPLSRLLDPGSGSNVLADDAFKAKCRSAGHLAHAAATEILGGIAEAHEAALSD